MDYNGEMDLLALVLVWPLMVLMLGIVFISTSDVASGALSLPIFIILLVFVFVFVLGVSKNLGGAPKKITNELEGLEQSRRGAVAFSIALLLPVFVKYLLNLTQNSLPTIILGLTLGFGVLLWGMFLKGNKVLTYANISGGFLIIAYLYFQLWSLGQLAQIIAAAFGLAIATTISIIKFREKLI